MRKNLCKLNILGQKYNVIIGDLNEQELSDCDGICKQFDKEIVIRDQLYMAGDTDEGRKYRYAHVIRHELIHALAQECGVSYDNDENLVDWIAHIIPILNDLSEEVDNAHK